MFYRVKQFLWGIVSRLTEEDMLFINTYLNGVEKKLFYKLPSYEQVHSIKVARKVEFESIRQNLYDTSLVKAALLHDIGKINGGLNLVNKSIMVILNKLVPDVLIKFNGIKVVNTYYNHPEIALSYLGDEDEYIKYLIRNHHNYSLNGDGRLKILQDADSQS